MQAKLATYRREGALALRHMWFVILLFSVVQIIVSIAVAASNSSSEGGYKSMSFAAIWAMFLVIAFGLLGARIVFGGKAPELLIGFLIGVASMLAQLFFVLAVIFFGIGTEAALNGHKTAPSDKAYGAFGLVNTIIYAVWAIILSVNRKAVALNQKEAENVDVETYKSNNTGEVYNPATKPTNIPPANTSVDVNVDDEEAEL
mmetsp:Transcript_12800/g.11612  ORF Transcript_12800/g.11612 Transcript_12800/m.11612 type:complete len:202 (+) Transcript_12800:95-700(+)